MKYFGIFEPEIAALSDLEIGKLMLDKGLLEETIISIPGELKNGVLNFSVSDNTLHVVPSKALIDEYYEFIIDLYKSEILSIKHPFFKKFNDEIFGLEFSEQKAIALGYFLEIYNRIYKDILTVYEEKMNEDGILHTQNFNKLKMLHYQLEANKNNLSETRTSLYYLIGDKQAYLDTDFIDNEIVKEVVEFEAWKQVVVELNSRFGFEDDYYFSIKFQDDLKFAKYNDIFKSKAAYQFTDRKIKSFTEDEKAKSVSLYQVLKKHDLVHERTKSKFKVFMDLEYGFSPAEIVTYYNKPNRTHDERVEQFSEDWIRFSGGK